MLKNNTGFTINSNSIIWGTWITVWKDYNAWDINFTVLNLIDDKYLDNGNYFKYWYTIKKWWNYELATTIKVNNINKAYIVWDYQPRQNFSITWIYKWKQFIIWDSTDINKFYLRDYVKDSNGNIAQIQKISDNKEILYLNNFLTWSTISLASSPEVSWLIKSPITWNPITNNSEDIPYNIN
jgi:hypothetical protein